MNTKTDLFFVYGSLKKGGYFSHKFDSLRIESICAEIDGFNLFDLGDFPCILPGKGKVIGELHTYIEPKLATMLMDTVERYNSTLNNGMYIRKRVSVKTINNEVFEANVYVFNCELPHYAKIVKNGFWNIGE
jgi:gamma-glutamylcyclotransferase (GGCT)/AIG2-like uncharacterized protein YtfP